MVLGFAVAIYRLIFEWDNNKNDLLSVLVVNPGALPFTAEYLAVS